MIKIFNFSNFALIFCLMLCAFFLPDNTYAYLDAGTGSYIIQIVIAFIVGSLFFLKISWNKMWYFLLRKKRSKSIDSESKNIDKGES
jgi:hypothetical protein